MVLPTAPARAALAVAGITLVVLMLASRAEARVRTVALPVPRTPDGRVLRGERLVPSSGGKRDLQGGVTGSPTSAEEQACAAGTTALPPCMFGDVYTVQADATDAACFVQIAAQNKAIASGVLTIPIDGTNADLPSNPCSGNTVLSTYCNSTYLYDASTWTCDQTNGYNAATWYWSSVDTTQLTFGNQNCVSNTNLFPSYMTQFTTTPSFYTTAKCLLALADYGGIVYSNIKVLPIFLGSSWNTVTSEHTKVMNNVTALMQGMTGSSFLGILTQYMRGATPKVTLQTTYIDSAQASFTDQTTLENSVSTSVCTYITNHGITDDTIYFPVFLGQSRLLYNSPYCAYHSMVFCQGKYFTYGLHFNMTGDSDCGGTAVDGVQGLMSATAHELFETMTDGGQNYTNAWLSQESPQNEIGDLCNQDFHWVQLSNSYSFFIQSMWSNNDHACVISASTGSPTSASPTSASPTSSSPSSTKPTLKPTSLSPTSASPSTTGAPVTQAPSSSKPTSKSPTTSPSTTKPTSSAPVTTLTPTSASPSTTSSPISKSPTSLAPVTSLSPTSFAPFTSSPVSHYPTSSSPTSKSPTTSAPVTSSPTPPTPAPTTGMPVSMAPTYQPTANPTPPTTTNIFAFTVVLSNAGRRVLVALNATTTALIEAYLIQVIDSLGGKPIAINSLSETSTSGQYLVLYHYTGSPAPQTPLNSTTLAAVSAYIFSDSANTYGITSLVEAITGSPSASPVVGMHAPHSGSSKGGVNLELVAVAMMLSSGVMLCAESA